MRSSGRKVIGMENKKTNKKLPLFFDAGGHRERSRLPPWKKSTNSAKVAGGHVVLQQSISECDPLYVYVDSGLHKSFPIQRSRDALFDI